MSSILVVEDDGIIVQDIKRTLLRLGYSVPRTASSGAAALLAMEEAPPDLVLMDIRLKGELDGIEVTSRIRERSDVPVVYLTSHSDEATLARAKETSPHGYLLKPFNERDLRTTIEVALRKHEIELQLIERERWFSTTLRSIGDAVIATDGGERITFMNGVAERLTGWSAGEAVGKLVSDVFKLVDPQGERTESPIGKALAAGFSVALPQGMRLVNRAGTDLEVDDSAAPIIDDRGGLLGGVLVFRDVTEQKALERRLAISERMASVGTLAAGMAHEINNPLTSVIANVGFAAEMLGKLKPSLGARMAPADVEAVLGPIHEILDALSDATVAGERVRKIIHGLKWFSRATHVEKTILDVPDVLDVAIQLAQNQLQQKAELRREYGTTPFVDADEGQLVQVFTNILVNAADAVGAGSASSNRIHVTTLTDGGGRAVVEVRDTGVGISRTDLERIFDPFFTTKPAGEGMGLGLAICHNFIHALGGEITAESEVGKGTCVRVALPAATRRNAADKAVATADVRRGPGRRGRVLVIDDEVSIGRAVERVLRDEHEVVVETDARAALGRIARGEAFDIIFCDIMMPEMTGADVFYAIEGAHPELAKRIVFLTGGAFSLRTTSFLESVANVTVSKPFAVDGLRAIVADYVK